MSALIFLYYLTFVLTGVMSEALIIEDPDVLAKMKKRKKFCQRVGERHVSGFSTIASIYAILGIIGLMSSQWLLFAALILVGFLPKGNSHLLLKIYAWISLALIIAIAVNRYQLNIDLLQIIKN